LGTTFLSRWPTLINTGRSCPIQDVDQLPWVLSQIPLQFSLTVENELGCGIKHPRALALVLIVDFDDAGSEIEGLRLGIVVSLPKSDPAIGHEDDLPASRRWNHLDIGAVIAERPCDLNVAYCFHFLQCVDESLVLAFLIRLDQNLFVRRRRVLVNIQCDANIGS